MTNALMLTLIAGLATLVGGFIGTHRHMRQKKRLSVMLAFAAGAMLCVSVAELIPEALSSLAQNYGIGTGFVIEPDFWQPFTKGLLFYEFIHTDEHASHINT